MYGYPIGFGLVISLVNIQKIKVNKLLGIVLCIGISALTFICSVFLTYGFIYIIGKSATFLLGGITTVTRYLGISTIFVSGGIAALMMYFGYSYLFADQNRKNGLLIVLVATFLVPVAFGIWQMLNTNIFINAPIMYAVSWMMLVSLGFSIAINQSEIALQLGKLRNFLFVKG